MGVTKLKEPLPGLYLLKIDRYMDERGYFSEVYNLRDFQKAGITTKFIQDNVSKSRRGVLRGLHFQRESHAQTKLVQCLYGAVYDIAVDLRKDSKTFGKYFGAELSAENGNALYIPKGFAHGFLTLTDEAIVMYKVDEYYNPESEGGVKWDDPTIGINWPKLDVKYILSEKDKNWPYLNELVG